MLPNKIWLTDHFLCSKLQIQLHFCSVEMKCSIFFLQITRRRSPSSEWRIISSTRRTPILLGDHNIPITTNTNSSRAKLNAAKNLYTIKLHCSFTKSIQQKLVDAVINHCLYSGIELEAVRNLLKEKYCEQCYSLTWFLCNQLMIL